MNTILYFIGTCVLASTIDRGSAQTTTVETIFGKIAGKTTGVKTLVGDRLSVDEFLGVPFAQPPLADLRFKPPVPSPPWAETLDATRLAPACMAVPDTAFPGFRGAEMWNPDLTTMSEDCLYLNIWRPTPKKSDSELKTVMVWIFGGGFFSGSPSLPLYNASVLAGTQDVIVVNINYRIAAFGFLFLDNEAAAGNMGLMDQQMALQWVYDNIESFGGDPKKITIFGESAGGASVTAHLIAPDSQRYVNRAIFQSGSMLAPWACQSKEYLLNKGWGFVHALGCNVTDPISSPRIFDCIKRKASSDISKAAVAQMTGFMDFGIVPLCEDDAFFKGNALSKFEDGDYKKVPAIAGVMKDEGSFWLFYYLSDYYDKSKRSLMSREDFVKSVKTAFGGEMNEVFVAAITQYYDDRRWQNVTNKEKCINAVMKGKSYRDMISQAVGDYQFVCSTLDFAQRMGHYDVPIYLYYFTHMSTQNPWPDWSGAQHGYEIEFEFGAPLVNEGYTKDEVVLANKMMKYWADFAKAGKPTDDDATWPRAMDGPFFRFGAGDGKGDDALVDDLKDYECRLWNQIGDMRE